MKSGAPFWIRKALKRGRDMCKTNLKAGAQRLPVA